MTTYKDVGVDLNRGVCYHPECSGWSQGYLLCPYCGRVNENRSALCRACPPVSQLNFMMASPEIHPVVGGWPDVVWLTGTLLSKRWTGLVSLLIDLPYLLLICQHC